MPETTWIQKVSQDWADAGNWSNGVPNGADFDVIIDADTPTIMSTGTFTIGSGVIGSPGHTADLTDEGKLFVTDTLKVAAEATLTLDGSVVGGTINMAGLLNAQRGTLDGVTYEGTLALVDNSYLLHVTNGITLTGSDGTGPGMIDLETGALSFVGDQTLDNATLLIHGIRPIVRIEGSGSGLGGNAVLTLGDGATIVGEGNVGHVSGNVVNNGVIEAVSAPLYMGGIGDTNNGLLEATDGGTLYLTSGLTNLYNSVLTGGDYLVDGAALTTRIRIEGRPPVGVTGITVDDADITLIGQGALLTTFFQQPNRAQVRIDATLTTIGADGALHLLDDRNFGTWAKPLFTNEGTLELGGGRFFATSIVNSGVVEGFGQLNGALDNTGSAEADGGALEIKGAVTGAGGFAIDAGAALTLAKTVNAGATVTFNGAGALTLGLARHFLGSIAGFGAGDTLDIANLVVSAVDIGGDGALMLKNAKGATAATLQLQGSYVTGNFQLTSDGAGGTLITYQTAPAAVALSQSMAGFGAGGAPGAPIGPAVPIAGSAVLVAPGRG